MNVHITDRNSDSDEVFFITVAIAKVMNIQVSSNSRIPNSERAREGLF
jgi:hypothetical protein